MQRYEGYPILAFGDLPLLFPEAPYEVAGCVSDVGFTCNVCRKTTARSGSITEWLMPVSGLPKYLLTNLSGRVMNRTNIYSRKRKDTEL